MYIERLDFVIPLTYAQYNVIIIGGCRLLICGWITLQRNEPLTMSRYYTLRFWFKTNDHITFENILLIKRYINNVFNCINFVLNEIVCLNAQYMH